MFVCIFQRRGLCFWRPCHTSSIICPDKCNWRSFQLWVDQSEQHLYNSVGHNPSPYFPWLENWPGWLKTFYCCRCSVAAPASWSAVMSWRGGAALYPLLPSAAAPGTSTCSHRTAGSSFHPPAGSNYQPCHGTPYTLSFQHISTHSLTDLSCLGAGLEIIRFKPFLLNRKRGLPRCAASTPSPAYLVTWQVPHFMVISKSRAHKCQPFVHINDSDLFPLCRCRCCLSAPGSCAVSLSR